jgi:hypothetical protein
VSEPRDREDIVRRDSDRQTHDRLESIERELREMRAVLVTLARVEERMANYAAADARLEAQMATLFARVGSLENATAQSSKTLSLVERGWWIAFAAVVAFFAKRWG